MATFLVAHGAWSAGRAWKKHNVKTIGYDPGMNFRAR